MRLIVWRKRFLSLIGDLIIWDILLLSFTFFMASKGMPSKYSLLFTAFIILLNIILLPQLRFDGSTVAFEHNAVICMFLGKVRIKIPYIEIKDYGTFAAKTRFQGKETFIYISKTELSENQRSTAYNLYKQSNGVIVFQYNAEAMELIRSQCPGINKAEDMEV